MTNMQKDSISHMVLWSRGPTNSIVSNSHCSTALLVYIKQAPQARQNNNNISKDSVKERTENGPRKKASPVYANIRIIHAHQRSENPPQQEVARGLSSILSIAIDTAAPAATTQRQIPGESARNRQTISQLLLN